MNKVTDVNSILNFHRSDFLTIMFNNKIISLGWSKKKQELCMELKTSDAQLMQGESFSNFH